MKNILVCVTGLTPQVVTETLYCLSMQKKILIDELYVVTTSRGRDVIIGTDEEFNRKRGYPALKQELERMCQKHKKIKLPKFSFKDIIVAENQSIELPDIRDDRDNRLFPNKLCEFINLKTKDSENVLHCSISGGRKSMSVDMAFAVSIFGRAKDKLWHVLTHADKEFKHFFPENKVQENDLELAEIPFVKLRSIIGAETRNKSFGKMKYMQLVQFTQEKIKQSFIDKILLDVRRNEVTVGDNEPVRLEPAKFKFYKYIIEKKLEGNESVTVEEILNECTHKFRKKGIVEAVSKITEKIQGIVTDVDLQSLIVVRGPDVFGAGRYGVLADKTKIKLIT